MITSRIRPLDVKLIFEDRSYKLGETIDLVVELTPRGDVEVREGRVDLVCEEQWSENYTVMVAVQRSVAIPTMGRGAPAVYLPTPRVPKQVHKEHKETYTHSSVVFLQDTRLNSRTMDNYRAALEIQLDPPPHAGVATLRWRLVTTIDVARARDIKARYPVKVTLA